MGPLRPSQQGHPVWIELDPGRPVGATTVVTVGQEDDRFVTRWFYFAEDADSYVRKVAADEHYRERCLNWTVAGARVADRFWRYAAINPGTTRLLHVKLFRTRSRTIIGVFLAELRENPRVDDALFSSLLHRGCRRHSADTASITDTKHTC